MHSNCTPHQHILLNTSTLAITLTPAFLIFTTFPHYCFTITITQSTSNTAAPQHKSPFIHPQLHGTQSSQSHQQTTPSTILFLSKSQTSSSYFHQYINIYSPSQPICQNTNQASCHKARYARILQHDVFINMLDISIICET